MAQSSDSDAEGTKPAKESREALRGFVPYDKTRS